MECGFFSHCSELILPKVISMNLSGSNVRDLELFNDEHFPKLQNLILNGTKNVLNSKKLTKSLKYLSLQDSVVASLEIELPDLIALNLNGLKSEDSNGEHTGIVIAHSLKFLSMDRCEIVLKTTKESWESKVASEIPSLEYLTMTHFNCDEPILFPDSFKSVKILDVSNASQLTIHGKYNGKDTFQLDGLERFIARNSVFKCMDVLLSRKLTNLKEINVRGCKSLASCEHIKSVSLPCLEDFNSSGSNISDKLIHLAEECIKRNKED